MGIFFGDVFRIVVVVKEYVVFCDVVDFSFGMFVFDVFVFLWVFIIC